MQRPYESTARHGLAKQSQHVRSQTEQKTRTGNQQEWECKNSHPGGNLVI
jgi:hypothetical protein